MGAACPAVKACQHDPDVNSPWPKLTEKLAKFTTLLKPLILLATNSMLKLAFHIIEGINRYDSWERISWVIIPFFRHKILWGTSKNSLHRRASWFVLICLVLFLSRPQQVPELSGMFLFLCVQVFAYTFVYTPHTCPVPTETRRKHQILWTRVTDVVGQSWGCSPYWELHFWHILILTEF